MRKTALVILYRLALLVALAASAALYIEYQNAGDPAFCGVGSGCMSVRMWASSNLGGAQLPTYGLAAFGGLFVFSLAARTRDHLRFAAIFAGVGGVAALVFIGLQAFAVKAFCKWCVAVDVSALVAAVTAYLLYREFEATAKPGERALPALAALSSGQVMLAIWGLAGAGAVGLPFIWGKFPVLPPLPTPIAALQVPDKITVVSFTDFECPFCRMLRPVLHDAIEKQPDRFALVRRMMPLPSHHGALPAALAYTCAPEDKRAVMADSLYGAPPMLLTREGVIGIAAGMKLDRDAFAQCLDAKETRERVEADVKLFSELDAQALPLTYVGPRAVLGYNPDRLREAVNLALLGPQPSLPVPWMLVALLALFGLAALVTYRLAPALIPTSIDARADPR